MGGRCPPICGPGIGTLLRASGSTRQLRRTFCVRIHQVRSEGDLRWPEDEHVTPQEEQLLSSLTDRVNKSQLQEKDADAEALLNRELGKNPDALYILAQTVLVQNIALDQARAQLAQLQQARPQPARASSFLGNLLGHRDPDPPSPPAYTPVPPPPAGYAQPQVVAASPGQPSFLRGAMQTAAGVAAGALAFEGVEAVLHGLGGYGHSGFGWGGPSMGPGMGMMGGGFERPVEETVVNNNYFNPPGGDVHSDPGGFEHGGEHQHFDDRDEGQLSQASYDDPGDPRLDDLSNDDGMQGNLDDSPTDDSGFDDSGSFGGDDGSDLV